jgi:hypothetical protein
MATGLVTAPSVRLPRGRAVAHVRNHLYRDAADQRLTQLKLYRKCTEVEKKRPPRGQRRFFAENIVDESAVQKIQEIENDRGSELTTYQLEVFAQAFDLLPSFFFEEFTTTDALEEAYSLARQLDRDFRAKLDEAQAVPNTDTASTILGFQRIADGEPIPPSRKRLAEELTVAVADRGQIGQRLVIIEGPTGVGKSFFIAHWAREYGKTLFGECLCLDCSTLSFDQILPALHQRASALSGPGSEVIADCSRHGAVRLIVLDGFHTREFRDAIAHSHSTPDTRPSIRDLTDKIAPILCESESMVMIVCFERNGPSIPLRAFQSRLPQSIKVTRHEVEPLDENEGVSFLWRLGVVTLSEAEGRSLSQKLMGIPLALVAAADDLRHMEPAEQERYLDALATGAASRQTSVSRAEFSAFVHAKLSWSDIESASEARTSGRHQDEMDPSPYAFLRLLALMPGPLSRAHLTEITQERRLVRLRNLSVDVVFRRDFPFTLVRDDYVDIHPMVREILREELNEFINGEKLYDKFTSQGELEWIHWKSAILHWRFIRNETDPDHRTVSSLEAFVYHMMAQARLVPKGKKGGHRRARSSLEKGLAPAVIERFTGEAGRLSNRELWMFAFEKGARPILLDSRREATKVYGQYEAKARILMYLVETAVHNGIPVSDKLLVDLYKEVALCWMHAGRLNSAAQALSSARNRLPDAPRPTARRRAGGEGAEQEHWRTECDIASVAAAIDLRRGREASQVADDIAAFQARAIQITGRRSTGSMAGSAPQDRGALRIVARAADLALAQGDYGQSLALFEMANTLQLSTKGELSSKWKGLGLDGEAARRWVVALVRTREQVPSRLEMAHNLVEANLTRLNDFAPSIDLIPFLTLQAALRRVEGELKSSEKILADIRQHPFVCNNGCTFLAMHEIDLEEIRLQICKNSQDENTYQRALVLTSTFENSHHFTMYYCAKILAAEACLDADRQKLLNVAREFFRTTNYRLRLEDISEIQRGHSAVLRYGL